MKWTENVLCDELLVLLRQEVLVLLRQEVPAGRESS
jgi:hypothetical protein